MTAEPELIDLATYRRLTAKVPRKAKKAKSSASLAIPTAEPAPRDGLTTLLREGWSTRTRDGGREHQLYQSWGAKLETGWYADQSDACTEAKALQRGLVARG